MASFRKMSDAHAKILVENESTKKVATLLTESYFSDSFSSGAKTSDEIESSASCASKMQDEIPSKSLVQLVCMGMVYFGIELLFSLEVALTVPILRKLGVPEEVFSYVYFVSPLVGFFFQPVLGILSDRCESRFGRRRPFILGLAISSLIGITFILNGFYFSELAGGSESKQKIVGISLVALGVTLLDFSADSCDSPLRALVLDTCNPRDRDTGLNIHAFLGGAGAALGYVMAGVKWNSTFLSFIGDEYQILSVFATVFFVGSLLLTMLSVKEKQFKPKKQRQQNVIVEDDDVKITIKGDMSMSVISKAKKETDINEASLDFKTGSAKEKCDGGEGEDPTIGFKTLFKSVRQMPQELIRLLICQLIGWLAFFSTTLFFTDFVAMAIYKGVSNAPSNSTEAMLYDEGVKMGSFCLLVFSISSAISAVIIEKFLLDRFGAKLLFLVTYALYSASCLCIFFLNNVYAIMPFCASFGLLMTSLTTLPYEMVSDFHKDPIYCCKSAAGTKRGIGLDCAFLCSCFFLAQTIISIYMGFLIYEFNSRVILVNGFLYGIAGFLFVLMFLRFPKPKTSTTKPSSAP